MASASEVQTAEPLGLPSAEAARRLRETGPNTVPEEKRHPLRALLLKFWAPVPWMLEAAVALEIALGKLDEAAVIAALLVLNAVLAFAQESRADRALALLRGRLSVRARVRRDGRWQVIPAQELVPGDCDSPAPGRHRSGRRAHRQRADAARPVGAHRRVAAGRGRRRRKRLRRLDRSPRRSDRRGDGDRHEDLLRPHRRAGAHGQDGHATSRA